MSQRLDPQALSDRPCRRRQCRLGRNADRQSAEHPDRPGGRARFLVLFRPGAAADAARPRSSPSSRSLATWRLALAAPRRPRRLPIAPRSTASRWRRASSRSRPCRALPHARCRASLSALAVAGLLLMSRRLSSRDMIGAVDWHLLLLFACLFGVTAAFAKTGLSQDGLAFLASQGCCRTACRCWRR